MSPVEHVERLLTEIGVDPSRVILGAVNREAWGETLRDADGRIIYGPHFRTELRWHRWPKTADPALIAELLDWEAARTSA